MRMSPLLADFIHARACKPFCEKSLTLPGFRQPIYLTGVNFYTFDNGEKGRRTQKSGASGLKNQAEAPLVGLSLIHI